MWGRTGGWGVGKKLVDSVFSRARAFKQMFLSEHFWDIYF